MARIAEKVASLFETQLDTMTSARYLELRRESDPETFEEFRATLDQADTDEVNLRALNRLMDSQNVGDVLHRMTWGVIKAEGLNHTLMTSDRPLTITTGIGHKNALLVMPISPVRFFAMAHNADALKAIANNIQSGGGVQLSNNRVVRQARKYAYASDDAQLRFVEARLGDRLRWSPFE